MSHRASIQSSGEIRRTRTWFHRLEADRLSKVAYDCQGVTICKSTDWGPVHFQQHVPVVGQLPYVAHQHVQLHLAKVGELSHLCSSKNLHHGAEVPQIPPWHRAIHHLAGPVFLLLQCPGHRYSSLISKKQSIEVTVTGVFLLTLRDVMRPNKPSGVILPSCWWFHLPDIYPVSLPLGSVNTLKAPRRAHFSGLQYFQAPLVRKTRSVDDDALVQTTTRQV